MGGGGENMGELEYPRLFKKAESYGKRLGLGGDASDFAQEYCIKCFEIGGPAKLDFVFKNYRDAQRADKRILSGHTGFISKGVTVSFDQPIGSENEDGPSFSDLIGVPGVDLECRSELAEVHGFIEEIIGLASPDRRPDVRAIYMMFIEEAYDAVES